MKSNYHLTTKDLLVAVQNAQNESVKSLVIQHNGVNLPVVNAAVVPNRNHSDLVLFVGGNQQSPRIDDLVAKAISGSLDDAIKLVKLKAIFTGALKQINELEQSNLNATNKPLGLIASFFSKKAKSPPLHKQITPAVITTISQIVGSKISTNTLNEIKTALSEVNEHFEELSNAQNPLNSNNSFGGDL